MATRLRWAAVVTMLMAFPAGALQAQDRPLTWMAAGVVTAPLSGTADYFNPGVGASGGVMWNLGEQYGVRLDGTWSTLTPKGTPAALAGRSFDISGRVLFATAAFQFQGPQGRAVPYILGGVGVYRRSVAVSGGGSGPVCVPWWFVCESGAAFAPAGSRSTTNVGLNVGLGVIVGRYFGEVRYHYAAGPTFATGQGDEPATGKFFPLTLGVRF